MPKNIILLSHYPEISLIFWDWNIDTIEEQDFFRLIETRIKYLYQDLLSEEEIVLINELCDKYNNGISLLKPR